MSDFLCVCPTWGRPRHIIENTIALFESQTHPDRHLIILDDLGNIAEESGDRWEVRSTTFRSPSLPQKYAMILKAAKETYPNWDSLAIWDDDDLYLPDHLANHAKALETFEWAHPSFVWSTYTGKPVTEFAEGRFYASAAVRREWFEQFGGWRPTKRADFDQLFLSDAAERPKGDPCIFGDPQFVFRWHDTHANHAQQAIRAPEDTEWYWRLQPTNNVLMNHIEPRYDAEAIKTIEAINGLRAKKTMRASVEESKTGHLR